MTNAEICELRVKFNTKLCHINRSGPVTWLLCYWRM